MRIQEIYDTYHIMPSLQLHMLRVAAVVQILLEHVSTPFAPTTSRAIITAALLHDMGNIIKSDLDIFPQFLEPEGRAYWDKVQQDYFRKYGFDEHHATLEIAKELGAPLQVIDLIDSIGVAAMKKSLSEQNTQNLVLCYADMRVTPHGVAPLKERLEEGKARWEVRHIKANTVPPYEDLAPLYEQAVQILFGESEFNPETITSLDVEHRLNTLRKWDPTYS